MEIRAARCLARMESKLESHPLYVCSSKMKQILAIIYINHTFLIFVSLVFSKGAECADSVLPGVYSRISAVYDWIQFMICFFSEKPPQSCGFGSIEKGMTRRVRVDVTYFSFASTISWEVLDSQGETLGFSIAGEIIEDSLVSTYLDLEVGEYTFNSQNLEDTGKSRKRETKSRKRETPPAITT